MLTIGLLAAVTVVLIILGWSVAAGPTDDSRKPPPQELRGVWSGYQVPPDWDTAMQKLSTAHFNAVFPYVCSPGVAYYHSKVLPISQYAQGRDHLAEAVTAGRKHGIAVHARILALELLFAADTTKTEMRQAGRLMVNAKGETAPWLCPSAPRNRELLRNIAVELATNYDIAGLQFDYLRYPWKDFCLCQRCRAHFVADTGTQVKQWPEDVIGEGQFAAEFSEWRQKQLTSLLAEVVTAARAARPNIIISAAVFPRWQVHTENFGQCAETWVESGLLDLVCPMNYTDNLLDFATWFLGQRKAVAGRVPIIVGIGPFSDACQFTGPEQVVQQIEVGRAFGAGGFVIFNYNETFAEQYLPYLAEEATAQPARTLCPPANPEDAPVPH